MDGAQPGEEPKPVLPDAQTADGGSTPSGPPPRNQRTLVWILAGAVALLVIGAAVAAALILPADRESEATATASTAEVGASSTTPVPTQTTPTTRSFPGELTTTTALPSTAGPWVEMTTPPLPGKADSVAVSDEALVVSTVKGLYAIMLDDTGAGAPIQLPLTGDKAGSPSLDGTLVAWWEGNRQENTEVYADQAIYAMRLPDGTPATVVDKDQSVYYPQLSGGYLTWVQPEPENGDPESSFWLQAIYGIRLSDEGTPQGEPELLTSAPRAYVLGTQLWAYSFDGRLLAWEQHHEAEGLEAGVQLKDLDTGKTTHLSSYGGRPSVAGRLVTYFGEALEGIDLTDGRVWTIDTRGDWATASDGFVVYLRSIRRQRYWEVIALRLSDNTEQILGRQMTLPWTAVPIAASKNHIAYVADDGTVKLFERRTD